jgi:hypothetical protein
MTNAQSSNNHTSNNYNAADVKSFRLHMGTGELHVKHVVFISMNFVLTQQEVYNEEVHLGGILTISSLTLR